MTFTRRPAADDPQWPRASAWLAGQPAGHSAGHPAGHPAGGQVPAEGTRGGEVGGAGASRPRLQVTGVPCSVGSISPSEAWRTPPAVREALARLSPWDHDPAVDLADLSVVDAGDWPVSDLDAPAAWTAIRERAAALDGDVVHAFLGGDNLVTWPLAAGLLGPDLADVGLLTLDAHHDVRHLDDGPRNGNPVRGLIADGLHGRNVVQVGIGAFTNSAAYAAWCREAGVSVVSADAARSRGVAEVVETALEDLAARCRAIYVDVDMDVLDVAFAPACPGARPGGLTPAELFAAVRACGAHPAVRAVDLVEVDASTDHDGRTVMATAMALLAFASGLAGREPSR